ncbi:MAG: hypothetical protein SGPRY_010399 [Prymnesium sp.]
MLAPLRVSSAIARGWSGEGLWSAAAVGAALGEAELLLKQGLASRHFMYTAHGRSDILLDTSATTSTTRMRASQFFSSLERGGGSTTPHHYFTSPVETLDASANSRLQRNAPLWERLTSTHSVDGGVRPWLQLWAGTPGVCTQAHYDVADNVFVQCWGTKEFLLYPPSAADALHVYPDSHPRARKSQVCLERPDFERHPRARKLPEPTRVVLEPGDALFIPAFHFHHVTALTSSISLNVFSESPIKLKAAEVLSLPPPLHSAWPVELKRRGLIELISQLLRALQMPTLPIFLRTVRSVSNALRNFGEKWVKHLIP